MAGERTFLKTFKYYNKSNTEVTISTHGDEVLNPQLTPIYVVMGNNYRKIRSDLKVHHKQYTGSISEEEREKYYDLAESSKVWVQVDSSWEEITIVSIEFDESIPHTEPIGLMFEWIVADESKRDITI